MKNQKGRGSRTETRRRIPIPKIHITWQGAKDVVLILMVLTLVYTAAIAGIRQYNDYQQEKQQENYVKGVIDGENLVLNIIHEKTEECKIVVVNSTIGVRRYANVDCFPQELIRTTG